MCQCYLHIVLITAAQHAHTNVHAIGEDFVCVCVCVCVCVTERERARDPMTLYLVKSSGFEI